MLGPELETFRSDKMVVATAAAEVLAPALAVIAAFTVSGLRGTAEVIVLACAVGPLLYVAWLYSRRVTLHIDGITYHTLFGEKQMRWDMIVRFDYEANKRSFPLQTQYRYNLHDAEGTNIQTGKGIAHAARLGEKLAKLTTPQLLRNALEQYNRGEKIDFGPVIVSRAEGIRIKKRVGYRDVPWNQVAGFAIKDGRFRIQWLGQKDTTEWWDLRDVTNAFALLALMETVAHPSQIATTPSISH